MPMLSRDVRARFRPVTRTVTLVLVDQGGRLLGALAPYEVTTPWWQEVAEVVAGARTRHQVDVAVLRLLTADRPVPPGGHVTYLASVLDGPPTQVAPVDGWPARLAPVDADVDVDVDVDLAPHPRRAPWAEPGGPRASLDWATEALAAAGRSVVGASQQRTWNLSAIWRLDTARGAVWLKQVPGFFAHEPAVLSWVDGAAPGV